MENFIVFIYNTLQSPYFLLSVLCIAITVKTYYIGQFIQSLRKKNVVIKPLIFLIVSIASALIGDLTWFIKFFQSLFIPIPYYALIFLIRIAWAALIVQYYTLSLFLQTLVHRNYKKNIVFYFSTGITILFSGYFISLAFLRPFEFIVKPERDTALLAGQSHEFFIMRFIIPCVIGSFSLVGLITIFRHMYHDGLPKILRKQIWLFMLFFIIPYFLVEFVLATWFTTINSLLIVVSISTLLLAVAVYYCLHNVLKVRFVNSSSRVHGVQKPQVIDEFKNVLRELSNASSQKEFSHITQLFFKEAFGFPIHSVHLTIREHYPHEEKAPQLIAHEQVEGFIAEHENLFKSTQGKSPLPLLVYDEIAFNNFYAPTALNTKLLHFLSESNLALFLPIYSNKKFVGYITGAKEARSECITHSEQDAMAAFATYLGNVIKLLHHRTINTLLYKEKKLKDSLYIKHQKINHYKESIHSFLRQTKQKRIGIVLYKNGHFSRANTDARSLISFDPNLEEGHPLSKGLKEVGRYVETFKTTYTLQAKDTAGHPLILTGVPHIKNNNTIITISYPDISDIILQQMDLLYDPNDWDYVLYLSSTKAGALINAFIPGNGEFLLNVKIKLLKAALNKKALLLNVPDDDLMPTVQLIHDISMRDSLHTLNLSAPTTFESIAPTLFDTSCLLQKLCNGTLLIKEIHQLDRQTQELFTTLITHGSYQMYPSAPLMTSNVRLLCTSHQILSQLVQKGRFFHHLYMLLKKETVTIPSVADIPFKELDELIVSFSDTLINSATIKHVFTLSEREKQSIMSMQPRSISELKQRVEQALLKKADDLPFGDTGLNTNGYDDPELILAARLGKQALKDEHIMGMLWERFKNQNKIALFLGVNRSSVNRRVKAYQLGEEAERLA